MKTLPSSTVVSVALLAFVAAAQTPKVEKNVIFGMYSGLALLMDVYRPVTPNGYGVVAIQGSGYYSPLRYDAAPISQGSDIVEYAPVLSAAGYTVFAINHRAAPRFHYPAAVEDSQRAMRFVRHHAAAYGIRGDRIGAFGTSSGGHLALLLGTLDDVGDSADADATNRESAKAQAIVAIFPPTDMVDMYRTTNIPGTVAAWMGFAYVGPDGPPRGLQRADDIEPKAYRAASPITHVTRDDAPTLLMHGDADPVVPFHQSELMVAALEKASVPVKLLRVPGGKHGPRFLLPVGDPRLEDYRAEAVRWFDLYLRNAR